MVTADLPVAGTVDCSSSHRPKHAQDADGSRSWRRDADLSGVRVTGFADVRSPDLGVNGGIGRFTNVGPQSALSES